MSSQDYSHLRRFHNESLLLDALCSKVPGVGRLLVMHAFSFTMLQKKLRLVALAYSSRRTTTPESKRIFEALEFRAVIQRANFRYQNMHGTWFAKEVSSVSLAGMAAEAVRVCSRKGMSETTSDQWFLRCPNA